MAEIDSLMIESVEPTDSLGYRSIYERVHKKPIHTKGPFASSKVLFAGCLFRLLASVSSFCTASLAYHHHLGQTRKGIVSFLRNLNNVRHYCCSRSSDS